MVKKILSMLMFVCAMSFVACDNDDDQMIPFDQLPVMSQEFIEIYYPTTEIIGIVYERDEYEVFLVDGTDISFYRSGDWDSVDGYKDLPKGIVPDKIADYIKANYVGFITTAIDKEIYGFDVEVNKGLVDIDLLFDREGNFIRIDID